MWSEYDDWAGYYDVIHAGLPGEALYYVASALEHGGRVLELGVGTGRIALPLAMSGGRVVGVDLSREMLGVCAEKAAAVGPLSGWLALVQGDMRSLAFGGVFEVVLMAYRTFMHLLTREEQLACLRGIYEVLGPGGLFIMNQWAPSEAEVVKISEAEDGLRACGRFRLGGEVLAHWCETRFDFERRWMRERHVLEVEGEEGVVLHREELRMLRAWLTVEEQAGLIVAAGFEVEALLGDFYGGAFAGGSGEAIWRLRKPGVRGGCGNR